MPSDSRPLRSDPAPWPTQALQGAGLAAAPVLLLGHHARAQADTAPMLDVPYVPTPQAVVDGMMDLAGVRAGDVLYDLGCGDGRVVVTAARRGARAVGIDLNPVRLEEADANARRAGVTRQVGFKVADLFDTDVSPASVVTLYLLPDVNLRLRPRLWQQLKVGTRVVSHAFGMGPDWDPESTVRVAGKTLHCWTITTAVKTAR